MKKFLIFLLGIFLWNCDNTLQKKMINSDKEKNNLYAPQPYVKIQHPEWSKNATIYQINTRQFTEEGTFVAAQKHLLRLKELGVDILWLMPINTIGKKNRKGTLGSPYSVKNYYEVNPEFGTIEDLKSFVNEAHKLGMYVILDWVANHTAWDNEFTVKHPEWYQRDYKGDFRPTPWWDWQDIINLDYNNADLRQYMTDAMKYWVKETNIDGYRCDVAGFVPVDFWNNVRKELDAIKPVFMLAEWESRDLHAEAFDMTYAWTWYDAVHKICKKQADVNQLYVYYSWNESAFPENSMRMTFVSNHDKNAWEGTMYEAFGEGLKNAITLSVIGEGMPLIYNGQEAGNTKRLEFFEKDPIVWKEDEIGTLYKRLFNLQKCNTALWHAKWGARMIKVPNNNESQILSFVRQNEKEKVFAVFNFSDKIQKITFGETFFEGIYTDFDTNKQVIFSPKLNSLELKPWSCKVFVK